MFLLPVSAGVQVEIIAGLDLAAGQYGLKVRGHGYLYIFVNALDDGELYIQFKYLCIANAYVDIANTYVDIANVYVDIVNANVDIANVYVDIENAYVDISNT